MGLGCEFLCSYYCLCGFGVSRCNSQMGLSKGWPCFLLFQTSQGQTAGSKQDEEIFSLIHRTNGNLARGSWTELSEKSSLWSCCGTSPPGRGKEARPRVAWAILLSPWRFCLCSGAEINSDDPRRNLGEEVGGISPNPKPAGSGEGLKSGRTAIRDLSEGSLISASAFPLLLNSSLCFCALMADEATPSQGNCRLN